MKALVPTLLLPLFLIAPLAAQQVELKFAPKKDAPVWFQRTVKQAQNIDLGGQEMESGGTIDWAYQVLVKSVADDGTVGLEVRIERIKGSISVPMMGDFEFDSATDKPAAGEAKAEDEDSGMGMPDFSAVGKVVAKFAGKTVKATVDAKGTVKLDEESKTMIESSVGDGMSAGMAGQFVSVHEFESLIEESIGHRPDKALAVGEKWTKEHTEGPQQMPMTSKVEMTLTKSDDEAFEITSAGTIDKQEAKGDKADDKGDDDDEGAAMAREMMKSMKIKNGKVVSSQRISRKDGLVLESQGTTSFDMTMDSPMGQGEMNIGMKMTHTLKRTTAAEAMATAKPKEAAKEGAGAPK